MTQLLFRPEITPELLTDQLQEIADRCMQAIPVCDADGRPVGTWRFDPVSAIKAYELLGKRLGMFQPSVKAELEFAGASADAKKEMLLELLEQMLGDDPELCQRVRRHRAFRPENAPALPAPADVADLV